MISLQFLYCPQSWKSCPQFRKSEGDRQKWPILAAKKVSMSAKSFLFSPNPYCHVLLAKNGAQIGQILLLWPNLYFTSGYRGSPPCTLSHYPDNRETGYSNVLALCSSHLYPSKQANVTGAVFLPCLLLLLLRVFCYHRRLSQNTPT